MLALCKGAKMADDYADSLFYKTYRGDNNGNDKDLQ